MKSINEVRSKNFLKKLVEIIKTRYTLRKVSNMYMVQVIEVVKSSSSFSLISLSKSFEILWFTFLVEIEELIESLLVACPKWIKKIDIEGNFVLRIDKKM